MTEEAVRLANKMKAEFWAVSSKRSDGFVQEAFTRVASLAFERSMQDSIKLSEFKQMNIGSTDKLVSLNSTATSETNEQKIPSYCFGSKCQF